MAHVQQMYFTGNESDGYEPIVSSKDFGDSVFQFIGEMFSMSLR